MNDHNEFLGRQIDQRVQPILTNLYEKIREVSSFGARILAWDLEKQRGGDHLIPPMLFLRNQIEIIESIATLIKDSLAEPCNQLLRSAIETHFYLEYLLMEDTARRALSFLVWDTHKNIQLLKRLDGQSEQAKQFKSKYDKDRLLSGHVFVLETVDKHLKNSSELLELENYKPINEEYLRLKKLKKGKAPNWFSLFDGPEDIERLADNVKLNAMYEGLYRTLSSSVHGTDILRGKLSKGQDGQMEIIQIRLPIEAESSTLNCMNIAVLTFTTYIENRLPERKKELGEWYLGIRDFYNGLTMGKR